VSDRVVTIIIPTFNQNEQYLRAALLSAKHQTYPCEIVIIDDGSTPSQEGSVAEVMEGYSENFGVPCKYVYQENKGVAGALNRGLEESTGDFIQWLPSDDLFSTKKTDQQLKYMLGMDYSVSYCSYEEGIPITANTWPAAQYATQSDFFNALKQHCFVNAATVMFRRSVIEECGVFNEDMVHAQDYEFLLRVAERYNFAALNVPLVRRRVHEGQMLRTLKDPAERDKKQRDMEYIKDKYGAGGHVWLPDLEEEEQSEPV
jgi:teichuronic acid biosynthesis glycosyltransferase TuaG